MSANAAVWIAGAGAAVSALSAGLAVRAASKQADPSSQTSARNSSTVRWRPLVASKPDTGLEADSELLTVVESRIATPQIAEDISFEDLVAQFTPTPNGGQNG